MNRIKKTVAVLAALSLAAAVPCAVSARTIPKASAASASGQYKSGEKTDGFTVRSVTDFDTLDATITVFEHDLSGARVEFIKNDDPNRCFMLGFDTMAANNKGIPHVFEHAVTNGSKKYPSRSLTMALFNRGYLTYGNALTTDRCTLYPIASLSEQQLLKYADYYTDLCFEPLILENEDIFRTEAWRYTLGSTSDDIKVTGTIYSEMSGSYTAARKAITKAFEQLYPGSPSSFDPGGVPSEVLKLTYDEVKDFHEQYYVPSNCVAYLYGDIKDPGAFLKLLDGYFTGFNKKGTAPEPDYESPKEGFSIKKYDHPAAAGSGVEGKTQIVYAIDLGDLSDEELENMHAFISYCNLDSSVVTLRLKTLYPAASFSFAIETDPVSSVLYLKAGNMNENDAQVMQTAVQKIFEDMAGQGLSEKELDNFRKRMETDNALAMEGRDAEVSMVVNCAVFESTGRGELFYAKMCDRFSSMEWFDNATVKHIASTYLKDAKRSAISVVVPRPGLAEENAKKLGTKLAAKKASMSEDELKAMVAETKRLEQSATDDPTEYLEQLNVMSVKDLPDKTDRYEKSDLTDGDRTRKICVHTGNNGINVTKLFLDASGIPQEDLGYLSLYVDLVNGHFVPAGDMSRNDIPEEINSRMAKGQVISLQVSSLGDDYTPYVTIEFMNSPDNDSEAFDLTYTRLFESSFNEPAQILEGIKAVKQTIANNMNAHPELLMRYLSGSPSSGGAYYENTHYIEYYDLLTKLEKTMETDPGSVAAKLSEMGQYIRNRNGAILGYAVDKSMQKDYLKAADAFLNRLGCIERKNAGYEFEKNALPLGVITDSGMVYNGACIEDAGIYGIAEDTPAADLACSIITDRYIKPVVRDRYGAYGCSYRYDHPAALLFTVRDPNIAETMEMYEGLGDAWKEIRTSMSPEDLEAYILQMYSAESVSYGRISDAMDLINETVSGERDGSHAGLSALKRVTVSDLARFDGMFEGLAKEGGRITVGSEEMINSNKESFARIIRPFD